MKKFSGNGGSGKDNSPALAMAIEDQASHQCLAFEVKGLKEDFKTIQNYLHGLKLSDRLGRIEATLKMQAIVFIAFVAPTLVGVILLVAKKFCEG